MLAATSAAPGTCPSSSRPRNSGTYDLGRTSDATARFNTAVDAVVDAGRGTSGFILAHGQAGRGKSVAADQYHYQRGGAYVRVWEGWTQAAFLQRVLFEVRGKNGDFPEDREHVLRIVAALCGPETLVCAAARGTKSSAWGWFAGGEAMSERASRACNFPLGMEPGVVLGDLAVSPKVQKFFETEEWRALWSRHFGTVDVGNSDGMVTARCRKPLFLHPRELADSLRFEFNLPYPATVLARLTWASKLDQGAEPGAVVKKELALSGIQRPLYPGELGEDAVEVFRFGDFAGWIIEG